ncbi:MAG TPA: hypothetical protein VGK74_02585 [Symbiobacteriaceae bacterium]
MAKYSKEQRAYLVAKAAYDTVYAQYKQRAAQELPTYTSEQIDALPSAELKALCDADTVIYRECGLPALRKALDEAENVLVAWGYEVVKRSPMYQAKKADLDYLFSGKHGRLDIHNQLVDMTIRLKATSIPA